MYGPRKKKFDMDENRGSWKRWNLKRLNDGRFFKKIF